MNEEEEMDREATFWKQRFNAVRQFFSRLGGVRLGGVVEYHLPEPPPEDAQLYEGKLEGTVDLTLLPPVELSGMSKLLSELQKNPDVKILRTAGSYDKGITITLLLEKPLSAVDMLTSIPGQKMYAVCKSGTFWLSK